VTNHQEVLEGFERVSGHRAALECYEHTSDYQEILECCERASDHQEDLESYERAFNRHEASRVGVSISRCLVIATCRRNQTVFCYVALQPSFLKLM